MTSVSVQHGRSGSDPQCTEVISVHAEIDQQTEAFQRTTGIRCPDGCGACCHSPHVEASVIDVLPLAVELVERELTESVIDRIHERERSGDTRCVLFDVDPADPQRGRCSMYAWRPAVCRLFGFAGRRDADGQAQYSGCKIHREVMPATVAAAQQAVREGRIPLPLFSDLAGKVNAIASDSRGRTQPINQSLREAMQRVALRRRYLTDVALEISASDDHDDNNDRQPPSPHMPPEVAA